MTRKTQIRILLLLSALILSYLSFWLFRNEFDTWDTRVVDHFFVLRSQLNLQSPAEHHDIIQIDANFYVNRPHHAQIIRNLTAMNVSALLFDFIFAEPVGDKEDLPLVNATAAAGNVYYGMTFTSLLSGSSAKKDEPGAEALQNLGSIPWQLVVEGDNENFYVGQKPVFTFAELSSVSRGLGFLNLTPDEDGILRRVPLLIKHRGAYYPSLSLQAVCGYLGASPDNIIVNSGRSVSIKQFKGQESKNIVIPIDKNGNLIINFTDTWRQIQRFSYREISRTAKNPVQREKLNQALAGKIVIVSENVDKSFKIRPIQADTRLSSGTIQAVVIHNILTGSFLREFSDTEMLLVDIALLMAVFILTLRFSSLTLSFGTFAVAGIYLVLAAIFFCYSHIILQVIRPLFMIMVALVAILIAGAIERAILLARNEKTRKIAERELEIGRDIQAGFFPTMLPTPKGWELVTHFQAARHVAGDFYDVFTLEEDKKIGIVIADVCDKGLGAALFMALFRSLIRVLSLPASSDGNSDKRDSTNTPEKKLHRTIHSVNNYISITHEQANMFATIFFGILDPESGVLFYVNAGHDPPVVLGPDGIKKYLNPTGPAVGLYPNLDFEVSSIRLEPAETLFAYTDGVIDAQNPAGESFSKERLLKLLVAKHASAEALVNGIQKQINQHIHGIELYDDITIWALRRN